MVKKLQKNMSHNVEFFIFYPFVVTTFIFSAG